MAGYAAKVDHAIRIFDSGSDATFLYRERSELAGKLKPKGPAATATGLGSAQLNSRESMQA
jgi:hypothetical protein